MVVFIIFAIVGYVVVKGLFKMLEPDNTSERDQRPDEELKDPFGFKW